MYVHLIIQIRVLGLQCWATLISVKASRLKSAVFTGTVHNVEEVCSKASVSAFSYNWLSARTYRFHSRTICIKTIAIAHESCLYIVRWSGRCCNIFTAHQACGHMNIAIKLVLHEYTYRVSASDGAVQSRGTAALRDKLVEASHRTGSGVWTLFDPTSTRTITSCGVV